MGSCQQLVMVLSLEEALLPQPPALLLPGVRCTLLGWVPLHWGSAEGRTGTGGNAPPKVGGSGEL